MSRERILGVEQEVGVEMRGQSNTNKGRREDRPGEKDCDLENENDYEIIPATKERSSTSSLLVAASLDLAKSSSIA